MTDPGGRTSADSYLADLASRLGDTGLARDLMDELYDHVLSARDAHMARGDDETIATKRAIKTLGSEHDLVHKLRGEMRRQEIARGAFALLVGVSALGFLWLMILATGPHLPWTEQREPLALESTDVLGIASLGMAVCAAIVANAMFWIPIRKGVGPAIQGRVETWSVRACRISGAAFTVAVCSILVYIGVRFSLAPRSLEASDISLGLLLTLAAVPFVLLPTVRSSRLQDCQ